MGSGEAVAHLLELLHREARLTLEGEGLADLVLGGGGRVGGGVLERDAPVEVGGLRVTARPAVRQGGAWSERGTQGLLG